MADAGSGQKPPTLPPRYGFLLGPGLIHFDYGAFSSANLAKGRKSIKTSMVLKRPPGRANYVKEHATTQGAMEDRPNRTT